MLEQKPARLQLYSYNAITSSESVSSLSSSNSHQLLIDLISESDNQTILSTYLKLIKVNSNNNAKSKGGLEFEIIDSALKKAASESLSKSQSQQLNYRIVIGDRLLSQEFLLLYHKEPKVRTRDSDESSSSDNSRSEFSSTEENDEYIEPNRKSSSTFESERNTSSDENIATSGVGQQSRDNSKSRKRKNESSSDNEDEEQASSKRQEVDDLLNKKTDEEENEEDEGEDEDESIVESVEANLSNSKRNRTDLAAECSSQEKEESIKKTK